MSDISPTRAAILGTAGHIDHGKTALIERMSGINTDRLPEERKRGISIELGFAFIDLPSGRRMGVVDVPGHERFVKQMLAGVGGMDLVMLVIAADEGVILEWRTSGEHDLLGFNLYCRGSEEELDHRVNPELIQAGAGRTIYHDAGVRSQGTYIYRLTQLTTNGREIPLGELAVEFTPRPREISLLPNVPNPFNPTTSIAFTLPSTGHVVLDILDASGRRVRRLASGSHEAGVHRMIWDGTDDGGRPVASGTYFARLSAGGRSESRRLNLIR